VVSARPAHLALISVEDFIAVQGIRALREGADVRYAVDVMGRGVNAFHGGRLP
jgi:hypothetical protein